MWIVQVGGSYDGIKHIADRSRIVYRLWFSDEMCDYRVEIKKIMENLRLSENAH